MNKSLFYIQPTVRSKNRGSDLVGVGEYAQKRVVSNSRKDRRVKQEPTGLLKQTVLTLLRWVEKNLSHTIRMAGLVKVTGYSSRQLGKGFLMTTGLSPARYILQRKLTQAAHLLRLTRRSVTDITMLYSFGSLQNFSRAFRRHFGLSPKVYRQTGICLSGKLQPPPARESYPYTVRRYRQAGFWLSPHAQQKIKIEPDINIVISDQGNRCEELYTLLYNRLYSHTRMSEFTVLLQTSRSEGYHVQVHTVAGTRTQPGTPGSVYVPAAYWLCFEFSGSLRDIMGFHLWVNTHGLKQHNIAITGGITATHFRQRSSGAEDYTICYCLPVFTPGSPCQARRNREAFPAV